MIRYFFILFSILISSLCAFSQEVESLALDNTQEEMSMQSPVIISDNAMMPFDYKNTQEWGKYKTLRAVGWTFLGVGGVSLFGGMFEMALEHSFSGKHSLAGPIMMIAGGVLTASSVPILIIAYDNRKKAKRMALDVGVTAINTPCFSNRMDYTPALSFALKF